MYNTAKEAFAPAGACPASHPVRMPQLAYETLWDTTQFNSMWPADGSNPFVLSYGDDKGYGTHADYVFGWKGDSLQQAMDSNCMFQGCENGRPLKSQAPAAMNACQVKSQVNEDIDGCRPTSPYQLTSSKLTDLCQGLTTFPARRAWLCKLSPNWDCIINSLEGVKGRDVGKGRCREELLLGIWTYSSRTPFFLEDVAYINHSLANIYTTTIFKSHTVKVARRMIASIPNNTVFRCRTTCSAWGVLSELSGVSLAAAEYMLTLSERY